MYYIYYVQSTELFAWLKNYSGIVFEMLSNFPVIVLDMYSVVFDITYK